MEVCVKKKSFSSAIAACFFAALALCIAFVIAFFGNKYIDTKNESITQTSTDIEVLLSGKHFSDAIEAITIGEWELYGTTFSDMDIDKLDMKYNGVVDVYKDNKLVTTGTWTKDSISFGNFSCKLRACNDGQYLVFDENGKVAVFTMV